MTDPFWREMAVRSMKTNAELVGILRDLVRDIGLDESHEVTLKIDQLQKQIDEIKAVAMEAI